MKIGTLLLIAFAATLSALSGCGGVLTKLDRSPAGVKHAPAAFSLVEPTIPVFRGE